MRYRALAGMLMGLMFGCYGHSSEPSDTCADGAKRCNDGAIEVCANSDWEEWHTCDPGQSCRMNQGEPYCGADGDTDAGSDIDAISESFDQWDGGGDDFYMTKPEGGSGNYADNNTMATIDGHDCLVIHADTADNYNYGAAVEFQLLLDQQVDMRGEDFAISFDIHIPSATYDKDAEVAAGLFETTDYTPIYLMWSPDTVVPDQWTTISRAITTSCIDYSGFDPTSSDADPEGWIFDAVRIQVVIWDEDISVGEEILFYVDNLFIDNYSMKDLPTDC
jgi:hypothetical protein